jgi:Tfp pilus assembly protein PilX
MNPSSPHKGFALLLALIVSSVVLAIGASILSISINQVNLSSTARESEFAFQAAHAGIDCLWYWRGEESDLYTATNVAESNPVINCFGGNPITSSKVRIQQTAGVGNTDLFSNVFEWGDPLRCTAVTMYVMNAYGGDLTTRFANKGIGNDGVKTCLSGNICTVIVSDGYNRSCGEIYTSIFSVQREITLEF